MHASSSRFEDGGLERGEVMVDAVMREEPLTHRVGFIEFDDLEQGLTDPLSGAWFDEAGVLIGQHFGNRPPARGDDGEPVGHGFDQIHGLTFHSVVGRKTENVGLDEKGGFFSAGNEPFVLNRVTRFGVGDARLEFGFIGGRVKLSGDREDEPRPSAERSQVLIREENAIDRFEETFVARAEREEEHADHGGVGGWVRGLRMEAATSGGEAFEAEG